MLEERRRGVDVHAAAQRPDHLPAAVPPVALAVGAQVRERSSPASDSTASRTRQRASQATRQRKSYGVPPRADRRAFGCRIPCGRAVGVSDLYVRAELKNCLQVAKSNVLSGL